LIGSHSTPLVIFSGPSSVKFNEFFYCFEIQPQSKQNHEPYFILTKWSQQLGSEANS
jgi:hypothetical protein